MSNDKLTDAEAKKLLEMLKHSLIAEITFPSKGERREFDVIGDGKKDVFAISIYRGRINSLKYDINARVRVNNTLLLELHINPTNIHVNPDGQKLCGSHWHIYTEQYGSAYAFPADDIESDKFVDNTVAFLTKFNVVTQPRIRFQLELL